MGSNTTWIIDDDPIFVFGSKVLLRNNGFASNIIVCQNGKEALDKIVSMLELEEGLPDVIFLDLNMPVMDGWEFLDEFSNISYKHNIRVYILSSSINSIDIKRAKEYSVVRDYITKPLTDTKIIELFKEMEE